MGDTSRPPLTVGVAGTGFISRHFIVELLRRPAYRLGKVLTRRRIDSVRDFPCPEALVTSIAAMIEGSDLIFECSGDPLHATNVVEAACQANRPIVTMNTEFHVTAGSQFVGRGLVSEAEGDQPGSQAAMREDALAMGFQPLVYGNMKGFLNIAPTPEEMAYWSGRQGTSVAMTTSFTDGTKLQFEQALVANGCGATFAVPGMVGIACDEVRAGGAELAAIAKETGMAISDYLISPVFKHGVFIVAEHDDAQHAALRYLKAGERPYFTLEKPSIFGHLEVFKSIERIWNDKRILLDNSENPRISVSAVAKRDLKAGTEIEQGIGSFDVRGIGVDITDNAGHLPLGLLSKARLTQSVEVGETIALANVEIADTLALQAWRRIEARAIRSN